jgi:glycosyltransferase involved in cell wall biosynthesis
MNICVFSTTFFPNVGGAERFIHGLALELSHLQNNVFVLVPLDKKVQVNLPSDYKGLKLRFLSPFRKRRKIFEFVLFLNLLFYYLKYRFHVIQAVVLYEPGYVAGIFGKIFKVPVILRPTGEDIQKEEKSGYGKINDSEYNKKIALAFGRCSAIVAISPTVKKNILDFTGGKYGGKIVDISNGVDINKFKIKNLRLESSDKDEIRLLTVGRNVPKKDYPTMIKAIAEVKKKIPNIKLSIVGGNYESLIQLVTTLNVTDEVKFLGQVPKKSEDFLDFPSKEVVNLYLSSDIFVFSSLIEGCPNVVLEAIVAGIPIVAANSPGTWDYVREDETGLLFTPGDHLDMASKIVTLITNKDLCRKLTRQQKKFATNFCWSKIARKYLELYNNLINSSIF